MVSYGSPPITHQELRPLRCDFHQPLNLSTMVTAGLIYSLHTPLQLVITTQSFLSVLIRFKIILFCLNPPSRTEVMADCCEDSANGRRRHFHHHPPTSGLMTERSLGESGQTLAPRDSPTHRQQPGPSLIAARRRRRKLRNVLRNGGNFLIFVAVMRRGCR